MNDRSNTIFGWVLFSGIVALGLSSLSSKYFQADSPHMPHEPGYVIEGGEEGEAESGPDLATLLASGSAELGAGSFAKCSACHTIEQGGANGIGPNLWGVMGTGIGSHAAGFDYSSALSGHGGDWDYANMDAWLASPRAFANGTKMSFAGLSDPVERANLILYLRENGGGPPLPEPVAAAEPVADEAIGDGVTEGEAAAPTDNADLANASGETAPAE